MPESREEDLNRNTSISILQFLPQNYLPLGSYGGEDWRVRKITISCLISLQMSHVKFGKDLPNSS